MKQTKTLYSLQVFRGIAASLVALFHSALYTNNLGNSFPSEYYQAFRFGQFGVDFFFVLSGFIIMFAHNNYEHSIKSASKYLLKRIARIYPAYLPIGILMIFFYSFQGRENFGIISSIFLLPSNLQPALAVAWTLIHEMVFYTFFLVFFFGRKAFFLGSLIWFLSISFADNLALPYWTTYFFSELNYDFLLGVIAALVFKKKQFNKLILYTLLSLSLFILVICFLNFYQSSEEFSQVILAFGFALLIFASSSLERSQGFTYPNFLCKIGDSSYSIYLIHTPAISIILILLGNFLDSWLAIFLISFFASIFIGLLYFKMVESPAIKYSKKIIARVFN